MNKIFVTSDTHFFHTNIIRYANRPFISVEEMNIALIERWNSRVGKNDTVYFLGDFAFTKSDKIVEVFRQLNGKINMVPGNHDDNKNFKRAALTLGPLINILPPIYELNYDGQFWVMCHYPIESWNRKHYGSVHLHGHSHTQLLLLLDKSSKVSAEYTMFPNGKWAKGLPMVANRYDVGVDIYGGPVEITGDCKYLNSPMGWE